VGPVALSLVAANDDVSRALNGLHDLLGDVVFRFGEFDAQSFDGCGEDGLEFGGHRSFLIIVIRVFIASVCVINRRILIIEQKWLVVSVGCTIVNRQP